ncbi:MAG: hypothetical protein BRC41_08170 [Cyanobacteria bacterium QH_9_48_43]|nr:MAG: hypothetical protein BRC41_08170 [Cyanobacteria bacterium QH_9_48_43]
MKFTGECLIQVKDAHTDSVKREYNATNQIQNRFFEEILDDYDQYGFFERSNYWNQKKVFISSESNLIARTDNQVNNVLAIAGGSPNYRNIYPVLKSADPPYIEIRNRIGFTGSSRSFNSIGLTSSGSNNDTGGTTEPAYTHLVLSSTVTQAENENLDFFYRIVFNWDNSANTLLAGHYDLALTWFDYYNDINSDCNFSIVQKPSQKYFLLSQKIRYEDFNFGNEIRQELNSLYKFRQERSFNNGSLTGRAMRTIALGYAYGLENGNNTWTNGNPNSAISFENTLPSYSLIGNIFGHNSDSDKPFYDSNYLANGSKQPVLSGSKSALIPELWRLDITSAGGLGVAEYKLAKRKFISFSGNNYNPHFSLMPFLNTTENTFEGAHYTQYGNFIMYENERISEQKFAFWDPSGVTVLNLFSGAYSNYDLGNVQQCYYRKSNNSLYVACRDTGLHQIDLTNDTTSNLNSDQCYGVTEANSKIYAVFEGRLANEDDFSVGRSFSISEITNDWSVVKGIKGNNDHSDFRLAIVLDKEYFYFWSETLTGGQKATVNFYHNFVRLTQINSVPAYSGKIWFVNSINGDDTETFEFGNSGSTDYMSSEASNVAPTPFIGDRFVIRSDNDTYILEIESSGNINEIQIASNNSSNNEEYINLGQGNLLSKYPTYNYFTLHNHIPNQWNGEHLNPLIWDTYSWDGSNWIKEDWQWDATNKTWIEPSTYGGKPTHTDVQPLVEGIDIKWEELDSSNPKDFAEGDYYTTTIYEGMVKDNVTSFDVAWNIFVKPTSNSDLNDTIPSSSPHELYVAESPNGSASDPNWIGLDDDKPKYSHSISIEGYAGEAELLSSSAGAPGANQVRFNQSGLLEFSSDDAGKSVTGTYLWIYHENY